MYDVTVIVMICNQCGMLSNLDSEIWNLDVVAKTHKYQLCHYCRFKSLQAGSD